MRNSNDPPHRRKVQANWPRTVLLAGLVLLMMGCAGETPTRPGARTPPSLLVLNSTGQTLAAFSIGEGLEVAGAPIDLGPAFDGQMVDASGHLAVSTVSSFGGSLIVLADTRSGDVTSIPFPQPEGSRANPSAASFDDGGTVWVGGRGSDALYRLEPGERVAERVTGGIGTFVERVVPAGDLLYAVDANIDDDGLTYRPLGPGRVVVLLRDGTIMDEIAFPEGVVNAFDAVEAGDDLIVLATGSFDETFAAKGDGHLVAVRLADRTVREAIPLQANGLSMELGADGDVYVATTSDFVATEILRYDPVTGRFVNGPGNGVNVRDLRGDPVNCWVATALADGRVLCATFAFAEAGTLYLTEPDGTFLDAIPSGFGSTDLLVR